VQTSFLAKRTDHVKYNDWLVDWSIDWLRVTTLLKLELIEVF